MIAKLYPAVLVAVWLNDDSLSALIFFSGVINPDRSSMVYFDVSWANEETADRMNNVIREIGLNLIALIKYSKIKTNTRKLSVEAIYSKYVKSLSGD